MIYWVIVLLSIAADRLTKIWALSALQDGKSIAVIKGWFELTLVRNPGASWGIFHGKTVFLIIISAVGTVFLLYLLASKATHHKLFLTGVALITGGAIGNLWDRIFYNGLVTDMFYIKIIDFPVFNVADLCVTAGAVCVFWYILFLSDKKDGNKL